MRRAAKIDNNQPLIVDALRAVGARVQSLAAVGDGVPDLLVQFRDMFYLLEVKDPAQPPSKRKLTEEQEFFHKRWASSRLGVVETPEEALQAIGAIDYDKLPF